MNVVIGIDKYQDWLEAYSIMKYYKDIKQVTIIYGENKRNNRASILPLFEEYKKEIEFLYIGKTPATYNQSLKEESSKLEEGDILAAAFVRYRENWELISDCRKRGVVTVHLTEPFPDSFGLIGYRVGYRWGKTKSFANYLKKVMGLPIMCVYAMTHKPDFCFYSLMPAVKNEFVKVTIKAFVPKLPESKMIVLRTLLGNEKRTLIVSGFEYEYKKIADYYKLDKYIATSKDLEIIIDGIHYPLEDFICAEEVLIGGFSNRIISYNSTAVCWAYRIGGIEIDCFESEKMNEVYGYYGYLSRRTLKKCGIKLQPPQKALMNIADGIS